MAYLGRTRSHESRDSSDTIQEEETLVDPETEISYLRQSATRPTIQSARISSEQIPSRLKSRTASHSLLSTLSTSSTTSRKGWSSEASLVQHGLTPASMSMPPPASKVSSTYNPAMARCSSTDLVRENPSLLESNTTAKAHDVPSSDSVVLDDAEKTPHLGAGEGHQNSYIALTLPESQSRSSKRNAINSDSDSNRLSFSSVYSMGSVIYSGAMGGISGTQSTASSNAGSARSGTFDQLNTMSVPLSPSLGPIKGDAMSSVTTATDPVSVTTLSYTPNSGPVSPSINGPNTATKNLESWTSGPLSRPPNPSRRSRSRTQRRPSGSTAASSASPNNIDRRTPSFIGKIGVCALDVKARSKPSRNILTRLQHNGEFEVVVFGDKVILDEAVENWPLCDFLISFFSDGFPLDKAIAYAQLRKPFCINDLPMQKVLWDRRICLKILDSMGVPTPKRIEVNRDGGPTLETADLARHVQRMSGVKLEGSGDGTGGGVRIAGEVALVDEGDTLLVDGHSLKKPFVEKPVNGEDHNIRIYYPKSHEGGGGRKLFRKIGNKSSEWDSNLIVPRAISENGSSYIYEQFLHVDNAEDVKAYTVGPDFCHAETRKSPVVDGLVRRNTHGKEIRYITSLTKEEATMASKIAEGFGQRICGFDLLRVGNKSYVIDVNGWSFVKDNDEYYDKCSTILKQMFLRERQYSDGNISGQEGNGKPTSEKSTTTRNNHDGHRSVLKTILKSPSLTRLTGSYHGHHTHGKQSPDYSTSTAPLTAPPSLDKRTGISLPTPPINREDQLPSPAFPEARPDMFDTITPLSADQTPSSDAPLPASKHSWKLKGMVAVVRHADRTPKQKFKFTFHTQPFVDLLKGHQEEVLLKGEAALSSVSQAVETAQKQGVEDPEKLALLRSSLARKGAWTGTKVQIKPMFRKRKNEETLDTVRDPMFEAISKELPETLSSIKTDELNSLTITPTRSDSLTGITLSRFSAVENDLILDKLQLIIKWGGEPTHSARYQSQDLGENMRNDLLLMNREALDDVRVFTSSERRVSTSAQIWAASFLAKKDVPDDFISVRKDLLDDSNAAKDVMDKVKKKLKLLLREGHEAPPQFAWPPNTPEPYLVVRKVTELMRFHRRVMRRNFSKIGSGSVTLPINLGESAEGAVSSPPGGIRALAQAQAVASIQAKWCCGEDAELFKERWEKLFSEFCDSEKVDPSKISELYDTMKFDALHNRQFLEWIFTPSPSILEEDTAIDAQTLPEANVDETNVSAEKSERKGSNIGEKPNEKASGTNLAQRMGFRRKSVMGSSTSVPTIQGDDQESYFKLFGSSGQNKCKQDVRLEKLRELYKLAKVLFDFVCPQEYGIDDSEKLEIGLLTSLPLLKEIVRDLEEVQASEDAKSFIYFTKESHIYTLLNCILEGGIKTKIERNAIPELDYLSQICFELYEAEDKDSDTFAYSIRITITPGCHTFAPLDVQLDSKHSIGCAPRRSLTTHGNWKEVIETLRAKFNTVKLPKSFLAVNLSERHAREVDSEKGEQDEMVQEAWSIEDDNLQR